MVFFISSLLLLLLPQSISKVWLSCSLNTCIYGEKTNLLFQLTFNGISVLLATVVGYQKFDRAALFRVILAQNNLGPGRLSPNHLFLPGLLGPDCILWQ